MNRSARLPLVAAAIAIAVLALSGCSTEDASTDTSTPQEPIATAAPSTPGVPNGQLPDPEGFEQARQCLEAAGLDLPELPSGAPSFEPGQTPPPGFTPPAGADDPSALFNNPQVSAALQACGIELPTGPSAGTP